MIISNVGLARPPLHGPAALTPQAKPGQASGGGRGVEGQA